MSPQATKNTRVFGYILLGVALVLAIFIPVTYYTEKDRFENSKKVMAEIVAYKNTSQTRGASQLTQFLTVKFTDPATNQIKTATTTLLAFNTLDTNVDLEMERKINLLPVGAMTSSFYHPASDTLTLASELPNGELLKPGTTIPFLIKLLIPFAALGVLLLVVGRQKN